MHLLNDEDGDYGENNLFSNNTKQINTFNNRNINNGININNGVPNNSSMPNNYNFQNQNMGYQQQINNPTQQNNFDNDIYINGFNENNGFSQNKKMRSNPSNYEYNNIEIRHNKVQVNKGLLLFISIIFAYIGFVIVGVSETSYKQNEEGKTVAVVANIQDRENREDFEKLKVHYIYLLGLMETSDQYEYEMEKNLTPYFTLSTKYSDNLKLIDSYMTHIKAISIDEKYLSLQTQMYETYNYIAIYSQKMNSALLNDDLNSYQEAMTWKQTSEESVEYIRRNLITFGETEAKIFNDKDLINSRLEINTNETIETTLTPTPTITTGNYGEETIKPTTTPTPFVENHLGGGRLDSTSQENEISNNENPNNLNNDTNNSDANSDDIMGIDNPYSSGS